MQGQHKPAFEGVTVKELRTMSDTRCRRSVTTSPACRPPAPRVLCLRDAPHTRVHSMKELVPFDGHRKRIVRATPEKARCDRGVAVASSQLCLGLHFRRPCPQMLAMRSLGSAVSVDPQPKFNSVPPPPARISLLHRRRCAARAARCPLRAAG